MRLRCSKGRFVGTFESEFAREVLVSDQLRVTILIGVIASAVLVVAVLLISSFDEFRRAFHGNIKGFLTSFGVVAGSAIVCLLLERAAISRMIRKQKSVPAWVQYLSAFVETSLPTAGMIVGSLF